MVLHPSKFIGSNLQVELKDGRMLRGVLIVIDPFGNLLLSNVIEKLKDKLNELKMRERDIGLVSVPRDTLVKIEMTEKEYSTIKETKEISVI